MRSLQKAEAYLEPKQASMMELFVNIPNGLLFSQKNSITDAIEIFKVKLNWSKSLRLLQRVALLVYIDLGYNRILYI